MSRAQLRGEPLDVGELLRRLNWTEYSDAPDTPSVHPRTAQYWVDVEERITAHLQHGNPPRLTLTQVRHDYLMRLVSGEEQERVAVLEREFVVGVAGAGETNQYSGMHVMHDQPISLADELERWLRWGDR